MDRSKSPLYYKKEGDTRWHLRMDKVQELYKSVPDAWDDTCPVCGEKATSWNRAFIRQARYCPNSHKWYNEINLQTGVVEKVVNNDN